MAALVAAACSDLPTGPDAPAPSFAEIEQSGTGRAYHGYDAPAVEIDVDGTSVTLCASWDDDRLWDQEVVQGVDERHFSYEFGLWDEESGQWVEVGDANDKGDGAAGCVTVEDMAVGTHTFRVKAVGHFGTGQDATNHHSAGAVVQATVGDICPAPTVTLGVSDGSIYTGGAGNTATVTVSGTTTHVADCAGGELQYRLEDSNPGGPGGSHFVDWTDVSVAADGTWGFERILFRANANRVYSFRVRVRNHDNPTWVEEGPVTVTVVAGNP